MSSGARVTSGRYATRRGASFDPDRFLAGLERQGAVIDQQLEALARQHASNPQRVLDQLTERVPVLPTVLTRAWADGLGLPFVDLDWIEADHSLLSMLPMDQWQAYRAFPLTRVAGTLELAMADPLDLGLPMVIADQSGLQVTRMVAVPDQVDDYLRRVQVDTAEVQRQLSAVGEVQVAQLAEQLAAGDITGTVPFLEGLIILARKLQASDIHLEQLEHDARVRMRIDGDMREVLVCSKRVGVALTSCFKVTCGMDIAEQRLPQDGRFSGSIGDLRADLRLSTMPTIHGEKLVMRLHDLETASLSLADLGFTQRVLGQLRQLLTAPHGLILVTGPTGSGKTTTLYGALTELAKPGVNVTTVEDPVEHRLGGINQVQINHKIGLDFKRVLRAVLRQDPDVVLVGEIRDLETAQIAIQASLTGHLVLASLHANTAPEAVTRLLDIGIPNYLVAQAVVGTIAQRLVRRICGECGTVAAPDAATAARCGVIGALEAGVANGCPACANSGYRGRLPVLEVLAFDAAIRASIVRGDPPAAWLSAASQNGFRPLSYDAAVHAMLGHTTLEEASRVHATPGVTP